MLEELFDEVDQIRNMVQARILVQWVLSGCGSQKSPASSAGHPMSQTAELQAESTSLLGEK